MVYICMIYIWYTYIYGIYICVWGVGGVQKEGDHMADLGVDGRIYKGA